jgi:hypothetical protein
MSLYIVKYVSQFFMATYLICSSSMDEIRMHDMHLDMMGMEYDLYSAQLITEIDPEYMYLHDMIDARCRYKMISHDLMDDG